MTSILEEAQEIIHGERNKTYGHPRDQFALVAQLWSDYLGVEVTPDDHAAMMVLLKLSRVKTGGYHRDAAVDIAGYAGTMERLREPVEPLANWERELLGLLPVEHQFDEVPAAPRVWNRLRRVPVGTEVTDMDGDRYKRVRDGFYFWGYEGWGDKLSLAAADEHDFYHPFEEVL